jgi:hypothetical protein
MPKRALVLLMLAGGCYGYYPIEHSSPVGQQVMLTLTDSGSLVLARQIGPAAQSLLGRVATDSNNAVTIAMSSVQQRDGNETSWRGEPVVVPRPLVANLVERRFSRGRTALLAGVTGLAVVALRQAFHGVGYSTGGSGLPNTGGAK